MATPKQFSMPDTEVLMKDIFPGTQDTRIFLAMRGWQDPVTYFVGRNGTGKSRAAKKVAQLTDARFLSTDRLAGLTQYSTYTWGSIPITENYRGIPLGAQERTQALQVTRQSGSGIDDMYALREQPEVWLQVAAFLRRALGRVIELRESSGYLDPYVRIGGTEYSLMRDEGHGLRELVILLTAVYREDWNLLVVDEPELHLHPSMARLWVSELEKECRSKGRRAIVVSHEPTLLKPSSVSDLSAIRLFAPDRASVAISEHVVPASANRVTASLQHNPQLVSQLVFSPRPVLVEGVDDVAALSTAMSRTQPPEVVAQTDFVECGGSGGVALWFEIARGLDLDIRAIADLDALLAPEVQRVMDADATVVAKYRSELAVEPPTTSKVIRPLIEAMDKENVAPDAKSRAKWLAEKVPAATGWAVRLEKLLSIWRDAGLWLHPQGTLEAVLGTSAKGREVAQKAASSPGAIDQVSAWCAFALDSFGDVSVLLGTAAERIAHSIMEALRMDPAAEFHAPVGVSAVTDGRLVTITPLGEGEYRMIIKKPDDFAGYWLDFSRDTPSNSLILQKPDPAGSV
jgi:predicted ATPase